MNFSASEIQDDLLSIKEKLGEGITLDDILSFTNLPVISEFSQSSEGLLPVNLIKVGEDGKLDLLSLTQLQQALSKGLGQIKDSLEAEIRGIYNSLKGEVEVIADEAKEIYKELSNLGNTLQKDNSLIADLALSTLNGATGLNINAQTLGNLKRVGENTIKNLSNLSPKQIKELADPDYFGRVVQVTLDSAIAVTGMAAEIMGEESITNSQLSNSAYMSLFSNEPEGQTKEIVVQREVYWAKGEGATPEAASKKSSWNGATLKNDYSLAVDNTNILIGDKLIFSDEGAARTEALNELGKNLENSKIIANKELNRLEGLANSNPDIVNTSQYQADLAFARSEIESIAKDEAFYKKETSKNQGSGKEREAVDVATRSKGIDISGTYPVVAVFFDEREKALEYKRKYSRIVKATLKRGSINKPTSSPNKNITSTSQLTPDQNEQRDFIAKLIKEDRAATKALDNATIRSLEKYASGDDVI